MIHSHWEIVLNDLLGRKWFALLSKRFQLPYSRNEHEIAYFLLNTPHTYIQFVKKGAQLFLKLDVKFKSIMINGIHILIRFYVPRILLCIIWIFFSSLLVVSANRFLPYWMWQAVCILNQMDHILSAINTKFLILCHSIWLILTNIGWESKKLRNSHFFGRKRFIVNRESLITIISNVNSFYRYCCCRCGRI